jgi:hypothetical protein
VPMHRTQRVRPSGASVGRPEQALRAAEPRRSLPRASSSAANAANVPAMTTASSGARLRRVHHAASTTLSLAASNRVRHGAESSQPASRRFSSPPRRRSHCGRARPRASGRSAARPRRGPQSPSSRCRR